jgi:hypothetical protein
MKRETLYTLLFCLISSTLHCMLQKTPSDELIPLDTVLRHNPQDRYNNIVKAIEKRSLSDVQKIIEPLTPQHKKEVLLHPLYKKNLSDLAYKKAKKKSFNPRRAGLWGVITLCAVSYIMYAIIVDGICAYKNTGMIQSYAAYRAEWNNATCSAPLSPRCKNIDERIDSTPKQLCSYNTLIGQFTAHTVYGISVLALVISYGFHDTFTRNKKNSTHIYTYLSREIQKLESENKKPS